MTDTASIKKYVKEAFPDIREAKTVKFLMEYIITGESTKSYMKVFKNTNYNSSAVLASRLLKKVKFTIPDLLDASGHTEEKMMGALDMLYLNSPKDYMKYMIQLRGLNVQTLDIKATVDFPILEILPYDYDEDTEDA